MASFIKLSSLTSDNHRVQNQNSKDRVESMLEEYQKLGRLQIHEDLNQPWTDFFKILHPNKKLSKKSIMHFENKLQNIKISQKLYLNTRLIAYINLGTLNNKFVQFQIVNHTKCQ